MTDTKTEPTVAPDGPGRYSITPLPARGPAPTMAWVDEVLGWSDDADRYIDDTGAYRSRTHPGRAG